MKERITSPERKISSDITRSLSMDDLQRIAFLYNLNNEREQPVWCKTTTYTSERVLMHVIKCMRSGDAITYLHEVDGKVISYYCGWVDEDSVTFDVGVVDITIENHEAIWREDTARMFSDVKKYGKSYMRISLSTSQQSLVPWMENEVGMVRKGDSFVWEIRFDDLERYIKTYA